MPLLWSISLLCHGIFSCETVNPDINAYMKVRVTRWMQESHASAASVFASTPHSLNGILAAHAASTAKHLHVMHHAHHRSHKEAGGTVSFPHPRLLTTSSTPLILFTTNAERASPTQSSATITRGSLALTIVSSSGMRSFTWSIFLSVTRIWQRGR